MKFNDRLKFLRKENKFSRDDLANKLGISYSTIAKYESGTREPDFETLEKISNIFEVSIDYLLGQDTSYSELEHYKNKISTEFPDIDLMFKDMESLTAEEMKEVYEYIKFKMSQKKQ
ncbi:XRE family transcriptional regulator [Siminovitchia terrae]|uniref:XRE family transcriptional regulator n=1 Tax=Siminovitchia terrae TaxID=1914933 RepID=A0A429X2R8_SIMTE|nr:helix-turn-helix transcriptional regulator [Siminovitchia terrae]RST57630.1 XRE family transcriptional regulator [Siminovitchia terrae]